MTENPHVKEEQMWIVVSYPTAQSFLNHRGTLFVYVYMYVRVVLCRGIKEELHFELNIGLWFFGFYLRMKE